MKHSLQNIIQGGWVWVFFLSILVMRTKVFAELCLRRILVKFCFLSIWRAPDLISRSAEMAVPTMLFSKSLAQQPGRTEPDSKDTPRNITSGLVLLSLSVPLYSSTQTRAPQFRLCIWIVNPLMLGSKPSLRWSLKWSNITRRHNIFDKALG